jgi:hypothetical protein
MHVGLGDQLSAVPPAVAELTSALAPTRVVVDPGNAVGESRLHSSADGF